MKTRLQILFTSLIIFCQFTAHAQTSKAIWTNTGNVTAIHPQLTTFTGVEKDRQVALSWSTANEQNSSHFIIERSSNGIQFDSVGAVTALGRFSLSTSYEFLDLHPVDGLRYYRLKIVGLDGKRKSGKVVRIAPATEYNSSLVRHR